MNTQDIIDLSQSVAIIALCVASYFNSKAIRELIRRRP